MTDPTATADPPRWHTEELSDWDQAPSAFPMHEEDAIACDGSDDGDTDGFAGVGLPLADYPFSDLPEPVLTGGDSFGDSGLDGPTADAPKPEREGGHGA